MTNSDVHISIINLARAPHRRDAMIDEMARAGIAPRFCDAIDLREVSEADLLQDCVREGPWGVFQSQDMACTLSHVKAWRDFLQSDAEIAVIFEDDVFVAPDLGRWLQDLSWWPTDADIVKLERWRSDTLRVLLGMPGLPVRGRALHKMFSRHSGSAGYMVTRRAAKRLLADAPYRVSIDQLLFNPSASPIAREMQIYQVQPALVVQGNDPNNEQMEQRSRPTGGAWFRQKLRRGYNEVVLPLESTWKLLTRRARFQRVPYEPETTGASPTQERAAQ